MKCPNCGSAISADARFCGECGQALRQLGKSLVEPAAQDPGPDLSGLRTVDDLETKAPRPESNRVLQPGDVFAGRYEVKQVIGEGGMGVVYRALDKLTSKEIALKLIRADRLAGKDAVQRLIREGVTSRDIRHANVVAVYDVGEAEGQPYMSMEFLSGQSLRAWTRKRLQTSTDCSMLTAANIIAQILAGLEAAHKAGVVHRDLKPENVMLTGEPRDAGASLKILDFGVARAAGSGDTGGTSLGTRGYMAPEQITAPDAAQPSADLYSLSVMFYELLVGVLPQGHWQPPSGGRSDVPAAIDKLIERGLSNNPRVRPQSVAEYGKALAEAMQQTPASTTFAPWLQKLQDTNFKPIIDQIAQNVNKVVEASRPQPAPPPQSQPVGVPGPKSSNQFWRYIKDGFTKNFINGKGRASRMEYWAVLVAAMVISFVGGAYDADAFAQARDSGQIYASGLETPEQVLLGAMESGVWFPIGTIVALIAALIPALAVTSRRLHDLGLSGWMAPVALLQPLGIGTIFSIGIGLPPGKAEQNQYGSNPLSVPA